MERTYTVIVTPDDGTYMVSVPALPGCFSQGDTVQEALEHVREAIAVHIAGLEADGEEVPTEEAAPALATVTVATQAAAL